VDTRDADLSGVHGLQNAGQKADSRPVTQLSALKAKREDFPQHGAPIGMPMRIPTG
jgi:hypothetical protein